MATLVLSTVGTALGGPIGGAIGSLVGQSIDQAIFASSSRGPRLGDLTVQTSSYGTQIPRIYGTMRIAGSIIWSTDLVESTMTSGAKGQPDTTYSYSVSFAVALSSRPAGAIRRIWADGKLLRGEAGDFKVNTEFRFYDGSEDQVIDPLIASIEGLANTPAYRGLALAVFENLELADFGNRIPFLTFEIEADPEPPIVGSILGDATFGRIASDVETQVAGYAASGRTTKDAVEPLIEIFGVELFDDGTILKSPVDTEALPIAVEDFGSHTDESAPPRIERNQAPARTLPASILLGYFDPQREYQAGQARADAAEPSGTEIKLDLPVVLDASGARSIAENLLARRWAHRDHLVLRLPPAFSTLQPGSAVELVDSPSMWTIVRLTIDGMVAIADLRPAWRISPNVAAESGRALSDTDTVTGPLTFALLDIPDLTGDVSAMPRLYLASSRPTPGWKRVPIEADAGGISSTGRTARRKSILGQTTTILGGGQSELLDLIASVDVQLVDQNQWLTSCDDDALIRGANLAMIGDELIQFANAEPLGTGRFRLTRLLRGRIGTEWACASHVSGDVFVLIDQAALSPIAVPVWARGSTVTVTQAASSAPASATATLASNSLRPPAPTKLTASLRVAGDLELRWTRRSRLGWAWVDDIDAPLGERDERYSIIIAGQSGTSQWESQTPALIVSQAELVPLGPGPATISVRQIGDLAASVPSQVSLTLP